MILQLEIANPQDAELILNLVRRLNIPFRQTRGKGSPDVENADVVVRNHSSNATESFSLDDSWSAEADYPRMDMASAAALLAKDYFQDEALTDFSVLDSEEFYEQR